MLMMIVVVFYSPCGAHHEGGALLENKIHCVLKLVVRYHTIVVLVNFCHDLVPDLLAALGDVPSAEDQLELFLAHRAVAIRVEHAERALKILAREEHVLLEGGRDELSVVDAPVTVDVRRAEHFPHVGLLQVENRSDFLHTSIKLFQCQESIRVRVKFDEHFPHFSKLLCFGLEVGNDGADARLERSRLPKRCQIRADIKLLVVRERVYTLERLEPLELEKFGHRWTITGLFHQTRLNELSGSWRSLTQTLVVGFAIADKVVDLLLRAAREWRSAC